MPENESLFQSSQLQLPQITSLSALISEIRLREDRRWRVSLTRDAGFFVRPQPQRTSWLLEACGVRSHRPLHQHARGGRESKQRDIPSRAWTSVKCPCLHKHLPLHSLL